tara:strand:- start:651 stop:1067 length:417 start_codon:yes stop_codon:yes gene_type:complete
MTICTNKEDKFLKEKTIWIASLSDGTVVYQDDYRKGADPGSSWLRLKVHVEDNGLHIEKISIRFRSHTEEVPEGEYYHFAKSIACMVGETQEDYFVLGIFNEGRMVRKWYSVPSIIVTKESIIDDIEKYRPHLIKGKA